MHNHIETMLQHAEKDRGLRYGKQEGNTAQTNQTNETSETKLSIMHTGQDYQSKTGNIRQTETRFD